MLKDMLDEFLEGLLLSTLETIDSVFNSITGIDSNRLLDTLSGALPSVYNFALNVVKTVTGPIGYTILGFCVLVALYETLTKNEEFATGFKTFEVIIITLVSFVVLKVVLDNAGEIMSYTFSLFHQVTLGINGVPISASAGGSVDWVTSTMDYVEAEGMAGPFLIVAVIALVVTFAAALFSQVMILVRFIELYVMLALAPLPLATLASPHLSGIGKNFLKSFIACILQAAVILLVVRFFPVMLSDMPSTMSHMTGGGAPPLLAFAPPIIYSVVMIAAIGASSALARKVVGLG